MLGRVTVYKSIESRKTKTIPQERSLNFLSAFSYLHRLRGAELKWLQVFMMFCSTSLHNYLLWLPLSVLNLTSTIWCSLAPSLGDKVNSLCLPTFSMTLMKTVFTLAQAISLPERRPLAYVVIPSTETISHRLENARWSQITTTYCHHCADGLTVILGCNEDVDHVQVGRALRVGGQAQSSPRMPSGPWHFQKVYCIMALVMEILTNTKPFLNSWGCRGDRKRKCHEMLNIWQSESHDLRPFWYTGFYWNTD